MVGMQALAAALCRQLPALVTTAAFQDRSARGLLGAHDELALPPPGQESWLRQSDWHFCCALLMCTTSPPSRGVQIEYMSGRVLLRCCPCQQGSVCSAQRNSACSQRQIIQSGLMFSTDRAALKQSC